MILRMYSFGCFHAVYFTGMPGEGHSASDLGPCFCGHVTSVKHC